MAALQHLTVAANTATCIAFAKGHTNETTMDPQSFHCQSISDSVTNHFYGPVGSASVAAAAGLVGAGLTGPGYAPTLSNLAGNTAIPWSVALPFQSEHDNPSHMRWHWVSGGAKVTNTTSGANLGGFVVTVQPAHERQVSAKPYYNFQDEPTYRNHGSCAETATITQIPRSADLAYGHPVNGGPVTDFGAGAATLIWLINDTPYAQTYIVDLVSNFMLAGLHVKPLSSLSVTEPAAKGVLEPALSVAQNTMGSAIKFGSVARAVAEHGVSKALEIGKKLGVSAAAAGFA
jgi:hypothetical protein